MKTSEKNILGLITLTFLAFLVAFGVTKIKAVAREQYFDKSADAYETEYKNEIKAVLKDFGAKNAGVTMTKTCADGVNYLYSVSINLPKYVSLENGKDESLLKTLSELELNVEGAEVTFYLS